jgi:predicted AAA+ superfamily ATPase
MRTRNITTDLVAALADTPVVFLAGARQSGRSTLVQHVAATAHPARYVTLDDLTQLTAARQDPEGFVAGVSGAVVIDEVQRAPELLLAIKAAVDRDRSPGRFLLTGSANVLSLPRVADTLVGRTEVLTLWPFSQGERSGVRDGFIDRAFGGDAFESAQPMDRLALSERIAVGGFPEAIERRSPERRSAWFESYVTTLLRREVRDLSHIEGVTELPRLLSILAARLGSLVNFADISRTAGIAQTTLKRYVSLLDTVFLTFRLPPWSANVTARLVKSPKLYFTDSGLAAHVLGLNADRLAADAMRFGPLLENFVVGELARQAAWSGVAVRMYHFRAHAGREVDVILEDRRGRCVAIEVKSTSSVGGRDVSGIRLFSEVAGDKFVRGLVLYTGRDVVPFAHNIHAVPAGALWEPSP